MKKSSGGKNTKQPNKKNILSLVFMALSLVSLFVRCFLYDNREANLFVCAAIVIFLLLGFIPSLNGKDKNTSLASLISAFALGLVLIFAIESSESIYGIMALIACVLGARLINHALKREFGKKDSACFALVAGLLLAVYLIGMKVSLGTAEDWFSFIFGIVSLTLVSFLATLPGLTTKAK